ncbi:MAG: PIG-L deacetylase family protein [Acidimicrobiales bacterium]
MATALGSTAIAPRLFSDVPERALAVYAHPDDPELSCGGTLATWSAHGSLVHVLVCTRGEKGSGDPAADLEDLARRRAGEMEAAGAALGLAGRHQLEVPDGELSRHDGLVEAVVKAVRLIKPQVILAPDPTAVFFGDSYFNHADHRVVGWAVLDGVAPAAANPHYYPTAGPAHRVETVLLSGTLEPDVWVDVSNGMEAKVKAVLCHASQMGAAPARAATDHPGGQPEWFAEVVRMRAADVGRQAGLTAGENFRRLRL